VSELKAIANRTFDEIEIGATAQITRTLTDRDVQLFAAVSGDMNPTHFEEQADGEAIAGHSMLATALISGVLGNRLPGAGTVYKGQDVHFARQLRIGESYTVEVVARAKDAADGTVTFDCRGTDAGGQPVFDGMAVVFAPRERIVRTPLEMPEVHVRDEERYQAFIDRAAALDPVVTAVVHPCDQSSLEGPIVAAEAGLIVPTLIGPEAKIRAVAEAHGIDIDGVPIVDVEHSHAAAAKGVELTRAGRFQALMKGSLHTDELMREVMSGSTGLRTERRISHCFVLDVPSYPGALIVTDAAINIYPSLEDKQHICQNAIDLANVLPMGEPRVAILSAVETVYPKIGSTIEAAALCKMADRGQITGGLLDGPLAFDNAVSEEAAKTKGIVSPVAGRANILLVPDLESGNMLAKQLMYLGGAAAAGIVLGARVPIVLTSRADSVRTRMASCAVSAFMADARARAAKVDG